jgi:hypothetical protein
MDIVDNKYGWKIDHKFPLRIGSFKIVKAYYLNYFLKTQIKLFHFHITDLCSISFTSWSTYQT